MTSYTRAALIAAGVVLCAATAVVTATGTASGNVWLEGLARALTVAVPFAVGIYALRRPPFARFGALLLLTGFVAFLTTLSNSDDEFVYSVGRVAIWLVEVPLLYLLLAFPTGRLQGRTDRVLVAAMVGIVAILYLPTALVIEQFPVPVPWASCTSECPDNAFMVTASQPAFVDDIMRPLREVLAIALFAAATVRLAQRIHGSNRLVRRTVAPVLVVACLRCAMYGGAFVVRRVTPDSTLADVWMWLLAFMIPLTALAFLVGLARWWVFIGNSTRQLAASLRGHPSPEDLRRALADAFDDPSLEVVYRLEEGQWADASGCPRAAPIATPGRCVTEIADADRVIAAIVHDGALRDDRAFIETATGYAAMTLDNHRLSAQAALLLRDMEESRGRIQAAAADERRRIARDLHDGAQQRLIALAINLEIAAERTGDDDGEHTAAVMRRLAAEVDRALEEMRALTHGIYAPALADRGLVEALRAAAARNLLPTTVFAVGVGRHPPEIESAAYFCCLEAMQNAVKHAYGATAVVIDLSEAGSLRVEVRDDGVGFDREQVVPGVGLASMHDRLAAVGGELTIVSSPGRGTRVIAGIPLASATEEPSRSGAAPQS